MQTEPIIWIWSKNFWVPQILHGFNQTFQVSKYYKDFTGLMQCKSKVFYLQPKIVYPHATLLYYKNIYDYAWFVDTTGLLK